MLGVLQFPFGTPSPTFRSALRLQCVCCVTYGAIMSRATRCWGKIVFPTGTLAGGDINVSVYLITIITQTRVYLVALISTLKRRHERSCLETTCSQWDCNVPINTRWIGKNITFQVNCNSTDFPPIDRNH